MSAFQWDAAAAIEALAAGETALWRWSPGEGRLRLHGAMRALGLGVLGGECSGAALPAVVRPQDRATAEGLLALRTPGEAVRARLRLRSGQALVFCGAWLEEGDATLVGSVVREPQVTDAGGEHDPLTGLLTRQAFVARAGERLMESGRRRLVVADLDRLRRLNEALGHERADLLLSALGARLSAAFPPSDLPARVGEDEFAVLTDDAGDPAERLRAALEAPIRIAGFDVMPTLALGAVEAEGGLDAPEASELLRRAELAVESAKEGGRGGGAAYQRGLETDQLSRLALEADLRFSLERREIEPFFQPIVRLEDGRIAGFEALMRWRHPRRGLLPPDDFIALAEETGLMPDLGRWMIEAAAAQLARWRRDHPAAGALTCSVNLSTEELGREGLVEHVAAVIAGSGLPVGALKLEITESQIMKDPEGAAVILKRLRGAGAGLALDDFGTGFSSLSYLSRLPFDTLKIDRYFVRTMGADEGSQTIVRSVATLGRDLALEVVAEGVETRAMAQLLLNVGCHYGQGYGYAPALPAMEAEVYLAESCADGEAPVKARA